MTSVLLTGAGGSGAENFLDALRRAERPYRVIGVDSSPIRLHLSTADVRLVIPQPNNRTYREAILAAVRAWDIVVVHPQTDPDVRAIGSLRLELPGRTYLPDQNVLDIATDKLACATLLAAKAVHVPRHAGFESIDDVRRITEEILSQEGQAWVRSRVGAGSRASLPVRSGREAEGWVRWWTENRGMEVTDFMVSEFLPGREFAYQSLWQEGELVAGQTRERLEYLYGHLTPSGQTSTPAVARTVKEPSVDELACRAIRALDQFPRGVFCVDLKEDSQGKPKVTEINAGRFFTTSNFFAAAGLNMPDLLIRCTLGERLQPLGSSPLEPDLYWIRMMDMGYRLVRRDDLDPWPRADSGL